MPERVNFTCTVQECNKKAVCRSLCGTHYTRLKRHGDPTVVNRYSGAKCSVSDCIDVAADTGMCGKHAQRVRRYGDPHYVTSEEARRVLSRQAQPKLGKVSARTYKKLLGRHEHRRVAESMLGRALAKGEIVHHVDGNKHNNDPSNLEIMTQSQHMKEHWAAMYAAKKAKACH